MGLFDGKSSKANAIRILRKNIIKCINKTPSTTYELSSLLWGDAAKCFPTNYSFSWDGAWFKLDLITRKLYADVCTYPNQFGANREERYGLTATEFHQKAIAFNMSEELQYMETDTDWELLFDNNELQMAIQTANTKLQEQREKKWQSERAALAIVIPESFKELKPTMEFTKIVITLSQRYGEWNYTHTVSKKLDNYILCEQNTDLFGHITKEITRELTTQESVWLERYVNACIKNRDKTMWQDVLGSSKMTVEICRYDKQIVTLNKKLPLKKYYDMHSEFSHLITYGSITGRDELAH